MQETAHFLSDLGRLGDKGKVSAADQAHHPGTGQALPQSLEASLGHQQVAIPGHYQGWHAHPFQSARHVILFGQAEAVNHDALIGLPASVGHKLKKRTRFLTLSKEQVEELVNEGIISRQGIARQHRAGDPVQKPSIKVSADSLNCKPPQATGKTSRELQGQHATKGYPHQSGTFQAVPFQKFGQVFYQICETKSTPQGKAIILTAQVVTNNAVIFRQTPGQRAQQLKTAG
jgi:hypothetical protein